MRMAAAQQGSRVVKSQLDEARSVIWFLLVINVLLKGLFEQPEVLKSLTTP
jgi:hypothetical protein